MTKKQAQEYLSNAVVTLTASLNTSSVAAGGIELPEPDLPVVNSNIPVFKGMTSDLVQVYLVETEQGMAYVQNRDLAEAGWGLEQLHETALANLIHLCNEKASYRDMGDAYGISMDEMFESGLILIDSLWDDALAEFAPNGFLAVIPCRNVLVVCDAASKKGLEKLKGICQAVTNDNFPYLLTSTVFKRENGQWLPFKD